MVGVQLARDFVNHYPLRVFQLRILRGAIPDNNSKKCDGNSDRGLQVTGNERIGPKMNITLDLLRRRGFAKEEPADQNFE